MALAANDIDCDLDMLVAQSLLPAASPFPAFPPDRNPMDAYEAVKQHSGRYICDPIALAKLLFVAHCMSAPDDEKIINAMLSNLLEKDDATRHGELRNILKDADSIREHLSAYLQDATNLCPLCSNPDGPVYPAEQCVCNSPAKNPACKAVYHPVLSTVPGVETYACIVCHAQFQRLPSP